MEPMVRGRTVVVPLGALEARAAEPSGRRQVASSAFIGSLFGSLLGSLFGSHLLVFARTTVIFGSLIACCVCCDGCAHVRSTCLK